MKQFSSMRKIKVCHIITKMVYGGASMGTLHLVERLDPMRFECSVLCGIQSEQEGDLLIERTGARLTIIRIPEMVREISLIKDIVAFLKMIVIIKKQRYDIIHTHGSKAGVIGRIAAAYSRVPVILYTVHGWGLKAGGFFTRTLFRLIEKSVAACTTKLLFQTKADMQEALDYGIGHHKQYVLIGNGIDLAAFVNYDKKHAETVKKDLKLEDKKIIGTVGRVSAQKNPEGFIRIAQEVIKKRKDTIFVFVGGGELLDAMRSKVSRLHLGDKIRFLGARDDVPEILANFDIFILPSLWEGMPRSVIEAMALSKPVIVSNINGIEELVTDGENGFIVPQNKIGDFAEKIDILLHSPDICNRMGSHGIKISKSYDFRVIVTKIESLYSQLI